MSPGQPSPQEDLSTCGSGACPHSDFLPLWSWDDGSSLQLLAPFSRRGGCLPHGLTYGFLAAGGWFWVSGTAAFEVDGPEFKSCLLICMILDRLFNASSSQITPSFFLKACTPQVLSERETSHFTARSGRTVDHGYLVPNTVPGCGSGGAER